jgi:hypothetical protein
MKADYMINKNISSELLPNISKVDIMEYINGIQNNNEISKLLYNTSILCRMKYNNIQKSKKEIMRFCLILLGIVPAIIILYYALGIVFLPFYLICDFNKVHEAEKYIDNPLYHDIFLQINNNIEFRDDKNKLKNLNIISSFIYVLTIFSVLTIFLLDLYFYIVFFHLDIIFVIINIYNYIILFSLDDSIRQFEKKINEILMPGNKILFKNYSYEIAFLILLGFFNFFGLSIISRFTINFCERKHKINDEKILIEMKELSSPFYLE